MDLCHGRISLDVRRRFFTSGHGTKLLKFKSHMDSAEWYCVETGVGHDDPCVWQPCPQQRGLN